MSEAAKSFIDSIKDYALRSQNEVGIPAAVIIAQACLETGYGKYVCKDMNTGKDSRNLFNIKGIGPSGSVTVWTTEYDQGVATKVKVQFRAYHNYQESFEDHSRLLLTTRYQPCMAVKNNPEEFARRLQKCGYATDPSYGDKLISIMKTYGLLDLKPEDNQTGKFQDVDPKRWYASTVEKATCLGLISSTSGTTFEPEKPVTRAEVAVVSLRLYGKLKS